MNPEYIVIVQERANRENVICATIAYSEEEADRIGKNWADDFHYVLVMPCDYSMRNS